jgi:serine/threonine-protein phosphatase 6 regulatory ankyrin repeat subunit B
MPKDDAFLDAATKGVVVVVKDYLQRELCQVDFENNKNQTALILAAKNGRKEIVDVLVAHGSDVNRQNQFGYTPFIYSCEYGHSHVAISLINAGCDHSLQNKERMTGMDYLIKRHQTKINEVQVTLFLTRPNVHSTH